MNGIRLLIVWPSGLLSMMVSRRLRDGDNYPMIIGVIWKRSYLMIWLVEVLMVAVGMV